MENKTGLDEFFNLLSNIKKIATWVLPAAGISPVIAALVELNPPWPPKVGLTIVTSSVVLLALIYVHHFLSKKPKKLVNSLMLISIFLIFITATLYFSALSLFVYQTPITKERLVKGYACTTDAIALYREKCPWLDLDELKGAEYEATRLWNITSIVVVKVTLIILWFSLFFLYAVILAAFVTYQSAVKNQRRT